MASDPESQEQPYDDITFTYEEISEGSNIGLKTWKIATDPAYWCRGIDINKGPSPIQLTTYVAECISEYTHDEGDILLRAYRGDFHNWTTYQFNQINRTFRSELLRILQRQGVYILTYGNNTHLKQLARLLEPYAEKNT
jgi:hypothetical protein